MTATLGPPGTVVDRPAPGVGGHSVVIAAPKPEPPLFGDFLRGIWKENPVLVQMLGMCPTMAVTNNVVNSVAMGLATLFVLLGSEFFVSLLKRFIPNEVRIASYILIIATFVTLADMLLEALTPDVHKALGPFIALIVANCLLLGRQESFAAKQPVGRSMLDAIGMGLGFTMSLSIMGAIREVLGNGTFIGMRVMPAAWEPWVIMVLPPGGFLTLGIVLLILSASREMRARRAAAVRLRGGLV
jgi:H+/Na+-translocating ferredoxin:NAD+ oxidoreductase subunit E